jgi:hypothetical protein
MFWFWSTLFLTALALRGVDGAAPLLEDNVSYRNDVPGRSDVLAVGWADSYSDGDSCYCSSALDHEIELVEVNTPLGVMTVREICELLGDGPTGSRRGRPLYNDIQCGNGPPNAAGDEEDCPGRTEYGQEGCKYIGPKWNFAPFLPPPVTAPVRPPRTLPAPRPVAKPVSPPKTPPVPKPIPKPVSPPKIPPVPKPIPKPVSPPRLTPTARPLKPPTIKPTSLRVAPLCMDFNRFAENVTVGDANIRAGRTDSYSVDDECYCQPGFDDTVGDLMIKIPGAMRRISGIKATHLSVREICNILGPGPGINGRPMYNDIQCGNGPASPSTSETICPGRTEFGPEGCKFVGPNWNWYTILRLKSQPSMAPTLNQVAPLCMDFSGVAKTFTEGTSRIKPGWADSYSVGNECYCQSDVTDSFGDVLVRVPEYWREQAGVVYLSVREICDRLGPGPGSTGRPLYNDIQCGNGPSRTSTDEPICPGRAEYGAAGCNFLGPKWNWKTILNR